MPTLNLVHELLHLFLFPFNHKGKKLLHFRSVHTKCRLIKNNNNFASFLLLNKIRCKCLSCNFKIRLMSLEPESELNFNLIIAKHLSQPGYGVVRLLLPLKSQLFSLPRCPIREMWSLTHCFQHQTFTQVKSMGLLS